MPRKKKPPLSLSEQAKKLFESGIWRSPKISVKSSDGPVMPLKDRINKLLGISEFRKKRQDRMLFFVMYDIESNKVRTLIHKYLKRKGCTPIQRSIFLANTSMDVYEEIKADLVAVQEAYENNDSIIVLPLSTDYLRMMKIIGQKIEVDVITHSRNTLFF